MVISLELDLFSFASYLIVAKHGQNSTKEVKIENLQSCFDLKMLLMFMESMNIKSSNN